MDEELIYYMSVGDLELCLIKEEKKDGELSEEDIDRLNKLDNLFETTKCIFIDNYDWYCNAVWGGDIQYFNFFMDFVDRGMTEVPTLPPFGNVRYIFNRNI